MTKTILVWGDTAWAAWLAATLHPHQNVVWLSETARVEALQAADGLRINGQKTPDMKLITVLQEAPKPDYILLATPIWATSAALQSLASFIPPGQSPPPIILCQIGEGGAGRVKALFGAGHSLPALLTQNIRFKDNASLEVGIKGGLALGSDHPEADTIAQIFRAAGVVPQMMPDQSLIWSGVFWALQANALSAILDLDPAQVYADPALFEHERAMLLEALVIIRRANIRLRRLPAVNVPMMARGVGWLPKAWLARFLARQPRPPISLWESLAAEIGRSDAAYLNGAIARQADALKLEAPINHALALTVTDIAEGRALWSQYRNNPKLLGATLRLAQR